MTGALFPFGPTVIRTAELIPRLMVGIPTTIRDVPSPRRTFTATPPSQAVSPEAYHQAFNDQPTINPSGKSPADSNQFRHPLHGFVYQSPKFRVFLKFLPALDHSHNLGIRDIEETIKQFRLSDVIYNRRVCFYALTIRPIIST